MRGGAGRGRRGVGQHRDAGGPARTIRPPAQNCSGGACLHTGSRPLCPSAVLPLDRTELGELDGIFVHSGAGGLGREKRLPAHVDLFFRAARDIPVAGVVGGEGLGGRCS